MNHLNWTAEFPAAITVCDPDGVILDMNNRAAIAFQADGGKALIGRNILDCHPEPARAKTGKLLSSPTANVYTIEKNGIKKLIFQSPWYSNGNYAGFVELSIEIPFDLPHFVRS